MDALKELHQVEPGRPVERLHFAIGGSAVLHGSLREGVVPESSHLADENARTYVVIDDNYGQEEVAVALENIDQGQATLEIEYRLEGADKNNVAWIRAALQRSMRRNAVNRGILDFANVSPQDLDEVGFKPVEGSDRLQFAA